MEVAHVKVTHMKITYTFCPSIGLRPIDPSSDKESAGSKILGCVRRIMPSTNSLQEKSVAVKQLAQPGLHSGAKEL
jgi:hypothetical protein